MLVHGGQVVPDLLGAQLDVVAPVGRDEGASGVAQDVPLGRQVRVPDEELIEDRRVVPGAREEVRRAQRVAQPGEAAAGVEQRPGRDGQHAAVTALGVGVLHDVEAPHDLGARMPSHRAHCTDSEHYFDARGHG